MTFTPRASSPESEPKRRRLSPSLVVVAAGATLAVAALALPGWNQSTANPYSTEPEQANPEQVGSAAPEATSTASISIAQFAFAGSPTVAPGTVVAVPNTDGANHTLTASDSSFDTGTILGGSQASFIAPSEPGTYAFFCAIHPSMTGTITVA